LRGVRLRVWRRVDVEKAREWCMEVKGKKARTRDLPTCVGFEKMRPGLKEDAEPLGASELAWKELSVKSCVF
jgi:hypothetical protein